MDGARALPVPIPIPIPISTRPDGGGRGGGSGGGEGRRDHAAVFSLFAAEPYGVEIECAEEDRGGGEADPLPSADAIPGPAALFYPWRTTVHAGREHSPSLSYEPMLATSQPPTERPHVPFHAPEPTGSWPPSSPLPPPSLPGLRPTVDHIDRVAESVARLRVQLRSDGTSPSLNGESSTQEARRRHRRFLKAKRRERQESEAWKAHSLCIAQETKEGVEEDGGGGVLARVTSMAGRRDREFVVHPRHDAIHKTAQTRITHTFFESIRSALQRSERQSRLVATLRPITRREQAMCLALGAASVLMTELYNRFQSGKWTYRLFIPPQNDRPKTSF